eukprot:5045275-Lingulodinium_polyedra.AAC.1
MLQAPRKKKTKEARRNHDIRSWFTPAGRSSHQEAVRTGGKGVPRRPSQAQAGKKPTRVRA